MKQFLPEYHNNRLPVLSSQAHGSSSEFMNEREILYKLFFDMKKDVNELKKMLSELLKNPSIAGSLNDYTKEKLLQSIDQHDEAHQAIQPYYANQGLPANVQDTDHFHQPVILSSANRSDEIHNHEVVEETLNIMDKEKELIVKALKKHRGKRKDAAYDLGISERTLYRKLKEYNIEG